MEIFIPLILGAAFALSAVKLALLPRKWRISVAALLIPLPFFFQERLAGVNLRELDAWLYSSDVLQNLCVSVMIQEIAALVTGLTLIGDIELGRPARRWKYLAVAPSLLLPLGILFVQVGCFNHLVRYDFERLTWFIAIGGFLALAGASELAALIIRGRLRRIAAAVHTGWILVLLAIFMPVVLESSIRQTEYDYTSWRDLAVAGIFFGAVAFFAVVFHTVRFFREKTRI